MSEDDDLLRKLGALAKEQSREKHEAAPLDDLARERIVAHLAAHVAPKRRARLPWAIAGLAAAAAVTLAVTQLGGPEPLPEYAMNASADATSRGPGTRPSQRCVLRAEGPGDFELVANAERPVPGLLRASAFLVKDGDLVPWPGEVAISSQGSVHILDKRSALAGATELRLVISRDGDALVKARGAAASGRGFQVLRCAIE